MQYICKCGKTVIVAEAFNTQPTIRCPSCSRVIVRGDDDRGVLEGDD